MRSIWFLAVTLAAFSACHCVEVSPIRPPASPSAEPSSTAGSGGAGGAEPELASYVAGCSKACAHLRLLSCSFAKPTVEGATCETVCVNAQRSGIAKLDTTCMAKASSCGDADRCGR